MSIRNAKPWIRYGTFGVALACLSLNISAADGPSTPGHPIEESRTETTQELDTKKAQVKVSFSDLDLSEQADVEALYQRIAEAARDVCRPATVAWYPGTSRVQRACFRRSMDRTVMKVGHYGLQQTHLAATGREVEIDERIAGR